MGKTNKRRTKKMNLLWVVVLFLVAAGGLWSVQPVQASEAEIVQELPPTEVWRVDNGFLQEEGSMAVLYSSRAGNRLSGHGKQIYDFLKTEITKAAAGEQTNTQFQLPIREILSQLQYTQEELGVLFRDPNTHQRISNAEQVRILNQFISQRVIGYEELQNVFNSLLVDFPYELYWYDKAAEGSFTLSMSGAQIRSDSVAGDCLFLGNAVLTFGFLVDSAYGHQYQIYVGQTDAARKAVENAQRIVREAASLSDYQKLVYYRKRICELVSYDAQAADTRSPGNQNPWQLVYVFDEDAATNVVCEGYAKAFQYLCDQTEFENQEIYSYIVTGVMTGGTDSGLHMWNIVHMGDQGNYLVDVTNCDQGAVGAEDALFLTGYTSGNVADGYRIAIASKTVSYQYRSYIKDIYSQEDLTLVQGGQLKETDMHQHVWEETKSVDASCTVSGKIVYTCSGCGRTRTEETAAVGHTYEAVFRWSEKNRLCTIAFVCKKDDSHRWTPLTDAAGQEYPVIENVVTDADTGISTIYVKDAAGKELYKLKVAMQELTAGNRLFVYRLDAESGEYRMVDDKGCTVNTDGSISVSLQADQTYQLLNTAQAGKIDQEILNTVAAQRASAAVKKGKSIQFLFYSGMQMENVKSIVYTSSKKAVARISAKGKITAKKAGTAWMKAKVTLKNGAEKTVSMKVRVKK